jgi:nucleoside-diphosphate-sugar epimerase
MKILITGATGFLGKAVLKECKRKNIEYCATSRKKVRGFIKLDITRPIDLKKIPQLDYKFDAVIHLAAKNHSKNNNKMNDYFKTNTIGTINVLEYCRIKKIKRFIFSSSLSVFGKNFSGKISEKVKATPDSEYGKSKFFAEKAIKYYKNFFDIDYSIIRLPMLVGFGMNKNVFFNLIEASLKNEKKEFEKNHKIVIAHVDDAANILVQAINKKGIFVFAQKIIYLNEITKLVNKKSISKITFASKQKSNFCFDLKKISSKFVLPKTSLNKIIKKTIKNIN